jgi:hypothetical protein
LLLARVSILIRKLDHFSNQQVIHGGKKAAHFIESVFHFEVSDRLLLENIAVKHVEDGKNNEENEEDDDFVFVER